MMLRNMVASLLGHERIQTTLAKAKEVRRLTDRVIVLAKKGDLHARRRALAILPDKKVVKKLFSDIGPRFQDRAGGFTRMMKLGSRMGDGAPLSLIMLAESTVPRVPEKKKKGKAPSKKATSARTKARQKEGKEKEEKPPEKAKKKVKKTASQDEPSEEKTPSKKQEPKKQRGPREGKQGNLDSPE
jgi:large subunit ribosomal protein L17